MQIKISEIAKKDQENIFNCYKTEVGLEISEKFYFSLKKELLKINLNSKICMKIL
jgi:hypothetical protein